MSTNKVIILISLFLIFILVITFLIYSNTLAEKNMPEGIGIDDLIFEEESNTRDLNTSDYLTFTVYDDKRNETNLSEYENCPVAILFFRDKEEDSITVLNRFESLYSNYKDSVKFLMIDVSQEVNSELKEKYQIPIFYDFYKEASRNYMITELPAMIYINANNEITNSKIGIPSTDAIEANLDIISGNY